MNQICPKCGHEFDPDALAIIECQCGRRIPVSPQRDEDHAIFCPCMNSLYWQDGKPVVKDTQGRIIKSKDGR